MSDTAHIFNPINDSLEERIRSYRSVSDAFHQAESSLGLLGNPQWSDVLGEKGEVEQAYEITKRSLDMAVQSIKRSELEQARASGLMTDREVRTFQESSRLAEIRQRRTSQQTSTSNTFRQKR